MRQDEIDEISDSFHDAWVEYFGQPMFYVPFVNDPTKIHPVYREVREKKYDYDNKVQFHGSFKQSPIKEDGDMTGKEDKEEAEITLVTKELRDAGIHYVNDRDIITVTDRDGKTKKYNIIANNGKVQFSDNKIFTKIKVVDIRGSAGL